MHILTAALHWLTCRPAITRASKTLVLQSFQSHGLMKRMAHSNGDRTSFLCNLMGISKSQASKMIMQNHVLRQLNETRLQRMFAALQEMQVDLKQILSTPQVFNYLPNTLNQRYQCLQELGFLNISVGHLLKFNTLMRCTPNVLRQKNLLKEDTNPLKELLSHTNDPTRLEARVRQNNGDLSQASIGRIRQAVLTEYLSWVLGIGFQEATTILDKNPKLKNRSLCSVIRIYVVLTNELDFSTVKIRQHPQLLTLLAGDIHQKILEFNLLAGVGYKWLANKQPKLLAVSANQIRNVVKLLNDFDVTDEQIAVCSKILLLPAGFVRRRLDRLKIILPDINRVKTHPQFLELICAQTVDMKRWIQQFEAESEVCTQIKPTLRHVEYFYNPSKRMEVILYVTDCLGLPQNFVQERLQPYPQWSWATLLNASHVISLLQQKGLTRDQIILGLPVILYSRNNVEEFLEEQLQGRTKEEMLNPMVLRNVLNKMEEKNHLSDHNLIEYRTENVPSESDNTVLDKNGYLRKLFIEYYGHDDQPT